MKGQCSRKGRIGKRTVYEYKKDGWRDCVLAKEGLVNGLCSRRGWIGKVLEQERWMKGLCSTKWRMGKGTVF